LAHTRGRLGFAEGERFGLNVACNAAANSFKVGGVSYVDTWEMPQSAATKELLDRGEREWCCLLEAVSWILEVRRRPSNRVEERHEVGSHSGIRRESGVLANSHKSMKSKHVTYATGAFKSTHEMRIVATDQCAEAMNYFDTSVHPHPC